MKKFLTMIMLGILILFTGCNPKENKDVITNIKVNPSEMRLHPGETSRLSVSVTPEKASYNMDEFVWSTSDSTVLAVSMNGTITALNEGVANVTVTYKELTSVCQVTVVEFIKDLFFTGVYFGVYDTAAYGDELDTIQSISGDNYYVKFVQAYVALFTAGFYISNDGELAGSSQGGMLEAYAPMYYAPGWANHSDHGTYFCLGNWYIYDTLYAQCMPSGKVNDLYLTHMNLFLENIQLGDQATAYGINMKNAGDEGCEGSRLTMYTYHTVAEGYSQDGYYSSYIPDLFFINGYFKADDNYVASNYMCSVEGHHLVGRELLFQDMDENGNFYSYGCHWNYNNDVYTWVDDSIVFDEPFTYEYNVEIFESANAPAYRQYNKIKNVHDINTTQKFIKKIHNIPYDYHQIK